MFRPPLENNDEDEPTPWFSRFPSKPFVLGSGNKGPGYRANFGITRPIVNRALLPVAPYRAPDLPGVPVVRNPNLFKGPLSDSVKGQLADNVEAKTLALFTVAVGTAVASARFLGTKFVPMFAPTFLIPSTIMAYNRTKALEAEGITPSLVKDTPTGLHIEGEDESFIYAPESDTFTLGRFKPTRTRKQRGWFELMYAGDDWVELEGDDAPIDPRFANDWEKTKLMLTSPFDYAEGLTAMVEKDMQRRHYIGNTMPSNTAWQMTQKYANNVGDDILDIASQVAAMPGKLIKTGRAMSDMERKKGESWKGFQMRKAGAFWWYGVKAEDTATGQSGQWALGSVLSPLAATGETFARNIGTLTSVTGLGQVFGVTPSLDEITYARAINVLGTYSDDEQAKMVNDYHVTKKWDTSVVPLPDMTDKWGAWWNHALQYGRNTYTDMPMAYQFATSFWGPAVVGSINRNIVRGLTALTKAGAVKVGMPQVANYLTTAADYLNPNYWPLTTDWAHNASMFAREKAAQNNARFVIELNGGTSLAPGANVDNIFEIIAKPEVLTPPSWYKTARTTIRDAADYLGIPTPSWVVRTASSQVNQYTKVAVDVIQEAFGGVEATHGRALWENLIDLGDYTKGMDLSKVAPKMKHAVEQMRIWFPAQPIDPSMKDGLKLSIDSSEWWTSTAGVLARRVMRDVNELSLDWKFLEIMENTNISRKLAEINDVVGSTPAMAQAIRTAAEINTGDLLRMLTKAIHKSTGTVAKGPDAWRRLQSHAGVLQVLLAPGAILRNVYQDSLKMLLIATDAADGYVVNQARAAGLVTGAVARPQAIKVTDPVTGRKTTAPIAGPAREIKLREIETTIGDGWFEKLKGWAGDMYSAGEKMIADRYEGFTAIRYMDVQATGKRFLQGIFFELEKLPPHLRQQIPDGFGIYSEAQLTARYRQILSIVGTNNASMKNGQLAELINTLPEELSRSGLTIDWRMWDRVRTEFYKIAETNPGPAGAQEFRVALRKIMSDFMEENTQTGKVVVRNNRMLQLHHLMESGWKDIFGDTWKTRQVMLNGRHILFDNFLDEAAYYVGDPANLNNESYKRIMQMVQTTEMNPAAFQVSGTDLFNKLANDPALKAPFVPGRRIPKLHQEFSSPPFVELVDQGLVAQANKLYERDSATLNVLRQRLHSYVSLMTNGRANVSAMPSYNADLQTFDLYQVKFGDTTLGAYLEEITQGMKISWVPEYRQRPDWSKVPYDKVINRESELLDFLDSFLMQERTKIGKEISDFESAAKQMTMFPSEAVVKAGPIKDVFDSNGGMEDIDAGMGAVYKEYIPHISNIWKKLNTSFADMLGLSEASTLRGLEWTDEAVAGMPFMNYMDKGGNPDYAGGAEKFFGFQHGIDSIQDILMPRIDNLWGVMRQSISDTEASIVNRIFQYQKGVLAQVRMEAKQLATVVRDTALYDYSDKFGFDTQFAERIFGYPYWFLRTFSDFPRQMVKDPSYISQMYRMHTIFKHHNEKLGMGGTGYDAATLQVAVPFELQDWLGGAETVGVPINIMLNPLANLLHGKQKNYNLIEDDVGQAYDLLYGWGAGPHQGVVMALAMAHWVAENVTGDEDYGYRAQQYVNHLSGATRMAPPLFAVAEENNLLGLKDAGGVPFAMNQVDSLYLAYVSQNLLRQINTAAQVVGTNTPLGKAVGAMQTAGSWLIAGLPLAHGFYQWKTTTRWTPDGWQYVGNTRDRSRAASELYGLYERGEIDADQLKDAAISLALPEGSEEYAPAQKLLFTIMGEVQRKKLPQAIMSFLGGPALNVRDETAVSKELMYNQAYKISKFCDTASPEECQQAWADYSAQFPAKAIFSTLQIDKESAWRSYSYEVLSRVGPGDQFSIFNTVGLRNDLVDTFYKTKGQFVDPLEERDFNTGIMKLGLMVKGPESQTAEGWKEALLLKKQLKAHLNKMYPATEYLLAEYFKMTDKEKATFLETHLNLKARLLDESQLLIENPIYRDKLAPYYISLSDAKTLLQNKWSVHPNRGGTVEERRYKDMYYSAYLQNRTELRKSNQDKQFLKLYGLELYHREYEAFNSQMDDMVSSLLQGLALPQAPQLRTDYMNPKNETYVRLQEQYEKHAEKIRQETSDRNVWLNEQAKAATKKPIEASILSPIEAVTPPPTESRRGSPRRPADEDAPQTWDSIMAKLRGSKAAYYATKRRNDTPFHLRWSAETNAFIPTDGPAPVGTTTGNVVIPGAGLVGTTEGVMDAFYASAGTQATILDNGYVNMLADGFIAHSVEGYFDNKFVSQQVAIDSLATPLANAWPVLQANTEESQLASLLYYVQNMPFGKSSSLREAFMKEGSVQPREGQSQSERQIWQRVIGTIRGLSDANIAKWTTQYPKLLGDLKTVQDQASNYAWPTLAAYHDIMGFEVSLREDGKISLNPQSIKPTDPNDRFDGQDVEKWIQQNAEVRFGEDIFDLYDQYLFLATTVGEREAAQFYRSDRRIGQYQAFREATWDRFNKSKKPPENKPDTRGGRQDRAAPSKRYDPNEGLEELTKYLDRIKKGIRYKNPNQDAFNNSSRVSRTPYRSKSYTSIGTRGYPIVPYRTQRANGAAYMGIMAKLRGTNPLLAESFRDFMEASPDKRTVILQANPDLARYLTGISTETFLNLEDSYRASVIATKSDSKSQASALKVYPVSTGRTGL